MDIELFLTDFMDLLGGLAGATEGFETFFGLGHQGQRAGLGAGDAGTVRRAVVGSFEEKEDCLSGRRAGQRAGLPIEGGLIAGGDGERDGLEFAVGGGSVGASGVLLLASA